jgi:hypothetical protein
MLPEKIIFLTALLFPLSNYCQAQITPIAANDPISVSMAPIQNYLKEFKPRPTMKPIADDIATCSGNSSIATEANFGGGKIQTINGLVYSWRLQANPDGSQCGALDIASEKNTGNRITTRFLTRAEFQELETASALVPKPTLNRISDGLFAYSFALQPCDSASQASGNLFAATPYVAVTSAALGAAMNAQGGCLIANSNASAPPLNRIALSEAAAGAVSYVRMSNPLFIGSSLPLLFSTVSQLPQGNGAATYHDTTSGFILSGSFFNMAGLNYDVHLRQDANACPANLPQPQRGGPIFGVDNNGLPLNIVSVISDAARVCNTQASPNIFYHRYDGPHLRLANYNSLVDFIAAGGTPNPVSIVLPKDNSLINGNGATLQAAPEDCAGGKIVAWKSTSRVTGQVTQLGQSSTCLISAQVPAGSQFITAFRAGTRWSKTVLVTSDRPQAQLTLSATDITLQTGQASVPLTVDWQSSDLGGFPLILTRQIGPAQQSIVGQGNAGQFIDIIGPSVSTIYTYRLRRELNAGVYETLETKSVSVTRAVQFPDFIGVTSPYLRWGGACFEDIPVQSRPEIHFSHNIDVGAVVTMNGSLLSTTPSQSSYAPGTYVITINRFPYAVGSIYGSGIDFTHYNANICIANAVTGSVQRCTNFWLTSTGALAGQQCARYNSPPIIGSVDLSSPGPVTIITPGTTLSQHVSWTSQNANQLMVTEQMDGGAESTIATSFSGVTTRSYFHSNSYRQVTYRLKGMYDGQSWLLAEQKIVLAPPSSIVLSPSTASWVVPDQPGLNGGNCPGLPIEINAQLKVNNSSFKQAIVMANNSPAQLYPQDFQIPIGTRVFALLNSSAWFMGDTTVFSLQSNGIPSSPLLILRHTASIATVNGVQQLNCGYSVVN